MKEVTVAHVKKAVQMLAKLSSKERNKIYDQEWYCGTRYCIWGHANVIAGNVKKENMDGTFDRGFLPKGYQRLSETKNIPGKLVLMLGDYLTEFSDFKKYFNIK